VHRRPDQAPSHPARPTTVNEMQKSFSNCRLIQNKWTDNCCTFTLIDCSSSKRSKRDVRAKPGFGCGNRTLKVHVSMHSATSYIIFIQRIAKYRIISRTVRQITTAYFLMCHGRCEFYVAERRVVNAIGVLATRCRLLRKALVDINSLLVSVDAKIICPFGYHLD